MRPKVIAIIQPVYLPWLGYFEQIARADHFVVYDNVQYTKQDWRNRNQILGAAGPIWLTVPVKKAPLNAAINEIEIDNRHYWAAKHLKSIAFNYRRAPYFERYFPVLQDILGQNWRWLADLDVALIRALCSMLQIAPDMSRSSEVPSGTEFVEQLDAATADPAAVRRNLRIIEVCRHHGAGHFYVGARAKEYIDTDLFARSGITVWFQDYAHPVYPQQTRKWQSHMAVIDLLMNTGPAARGILLSSPPPAFVARMV